MKGAMDELKERLPDVFERCEGDWFGVWVLHNRHRGRFRSSKKKKDVGVGEGMFFFFILSIAERGLVFFVAKLSLGLFQPVRGLALGEIACMILFTTFGGGGEGVRKVVVVVVVVMSILPRGLPVLFCYHKRRISIRSETIKKRPRFIDFVPSATNQEALRGHGNGHGNGHGHVVAVDGIGTWNTPCCETGSMPYVRDGKYTDNTSVTARNPRSWQDPPPVA